MTNFNPVIEKAISASRSMSIQEMKELRRHFSNQNPKVFNTDLIEEELNALYEIFDRIESE